jgi:hypothetical protein
MNRGGQYKRDQVTVTEAVLCYEQEKPNNGHRVTLPLIAKRFGVKDYDLINTRRCLSPRVKKTSGNKRKQ